MSITFEELLKIEYGTPFSELRIEASRVFREVYRKVGGNEYVCAYAAEVEGEVIFCGFAWVASDGVAEWIFTGDSESDDESKLRPPDCLLPKPGMFSYQAMVEHGKAVDPEHFNDAVVRQCRVSFGNFTYYYRKAMPSEGDYPIAIEVDLRPWKHTRVA